MQDRNLSGMSWVKVGDGRFRTPIPKTAKDRRGKLAGVKSNNPCEQSEFTLVEDCIPCELYWSEQVDTLMLMHCEKIKEETFKKLMVLLGSEFWTRKETSCDLELDTTGAYSFVNIVWLHSTMLRHDACSLSTLLLITTVA